MNLFKFIFLSAFYLGISQLNAQTVNYLNYKTSGLKKGKEITAGKIEMWVGNDFMRVHKTEGKYPMPLKTIDFKSKLVTFDFREKKEYVVEELDSIIKLNSKLVATGETENVNGYNCKVYKSERSLIIDGVGIYGLQSVTKDYLFKVWITDEAVVGGEDFSLYISSCLNMNMCNFKHNGTIVKIECTMDKYTGVITLDKVMNGTKEEKTYTQPWKSAEKYTPVLPERNNTGYGCNILYTSESFDTYWKRLRALLTTVTGEEKPKYKEAPTTIAYY